MISGPIDLDWLNAIPESKMPRRKPAPVEDWHPTHAADIDIRIDADGRWYHKGAPIKRAGLVALFASILRREDDGSYALVTPAEKRFIEVEDVPFVVTGISVEGGPGTGGQNIWLTTNIGDEVKAGPDNPLRFAASDKYHGVLVPYVVVRGRLEARIGRAVYYDLIDAGSVEHNQGEEWFGVWSGGVFWPIMTAAAAGA
jgi:hypothetical protein